MFEKYDQVIRKLGGWFGNIGGAMLLAIPIMTFCDIIGTKFFSRPVIGSVEITGFLQVMWIPLAATLTLFHNQHVKVEIFTRRLSESARAALDGIISLILFCLCAIMGWRIVLYGITVQTSGRYSSTLHLPYYYFIYIMSLGLFLLSLAFLLGFFKWVRGETK